MVDILNPTPLPFNTDTGQELYKVGRPGTRDGKPSFQGGNSLISHPPLGGLWERQFGRVPDRHAWYGRSAPCCRTGRSRQVQGWVKKESTAQM